MGENPQLEIFKNMVSVIVPTYKRVQIISKTIKSILNQTYNNLEVKVVSDCIDNETRNIIKRESDDRVSYYEIEHSGRPAVPRNYGIRMARGEFIAFCDDDDVWMPDKLTLQIAKMHNDDKLGLVYTKCLLKEGRKERIVPSKGKEGSIFKELFLSFCFIATSSVLIRRDIFENVGMFDEDIRLKAVEDYDLWLRIARRYKIGFVDEPLVVHKENNSSLTRGKLIKIQRHHLVPCKFYQKKYVGLGLFINKLFRIFLRSILELAHLK